MLLENTDEMESKGLPGPGRISLQAVEKEQVELLSLGLGALVVG